MSQVTEDYIELRLQSHSKAMDNVVNQLSKDFKSLKDDIPSTIIDTIKVTVNGKIDKLQQEFTANREAQEKIHDELSKKMDLLSKQIAPFVETKHWFANFKTGATWIAGFITPLALIGGVLMYLIDQIKN